MTKGWVSAKTSDTSGTQVGILASWPALPADPDEFGLITKAAPGQTALSGTN